MSLFQSIKVISLDAMNTIIKLRESPGETYAKFVLSKYQISIDPNVINKNFRNIFNLMEKKEPCYSFGNKGTRYWWKEIIQLSFQEYSNIIDENCINNLANDMFDFYSTPTPWCLIDPELNDIIKTLRTDKNIKIAITSNFDYRLRKILESLKIDQIDAWFLSGELGVEKPSIKIFNLLKRHFEINKPNEIIHIGDSLERDYLGARNAKIQSFLYNNQKFDYLDNQIPKNHIINKISNFLKNLK